MSIADIRLLEACTRLHEVARVIENDLGVGEISKQVRNSADQLHQLIKGTKNGTN